MGAENGKNSTGKADGNNKLRGFFSRFPLKWADKNDPHGNSFHEQPTLPLARPVYTPEVTVLDNESFRTEPPQLLAACAQSVGRQREHNEDALFTLTTALASDSISMAFGLYIVADGMGGHRYGEIASDLAVRSMANLLVRKVYMNSLNPHPSAPTDAIQDLMRAGVQEAHRNILREAMGAGTTLTAALILGEQLTIAHVGDSRAYLLNANGELKPLTRDHSLVRRLEEMGQITHEEASTHPQRNVLYRALGQGEPFEAEVSSFPVSKGANLILCSDGLWGVVEENQLVAIVQNAESPEQACQQMVAAANEAGGPDNITVILVSLP